MNRPMKQEGIVFVLLMMGMSVLISCLPDPEEPFDVAAQFESELENIDSYLETNLIEADTDSVSLIRYIMIEEGTGEFPEPTDSVNITYEGRFLSDEEFDSGTTTFKLNNLIPAWQIMIPKVMEGGTIEFYAPSYYCYGTRGAGTSIPGNTPLIFRVTLHAIKPSS